MSTSIKIEIAGRHYPVSVSKSEEKELQDLATEIKETFDKLKVSYAIKDNQDLLAMTLLQIGMGREKKEGHSFEGFEKQISELESLSQSLVETLSTS